MTALYLVPPPFWPVCLCAVGRRGSVYLLRSSPTFERILTLRTTTVQPLAFAVSIRRIAHSTFRVRHCFLASFAGPFFLASAVFGPNAGQLSLVCEITRWRVVSVVGYCVG